MGEVYRARDTSLGREVALKVLPAAFAQDAERVARFEREAKTLATLNHPGIAAIYGIENSQHVYALVMELVEGPTLADRISRGAFPIEEALPAARQIAEALEVAHERGIAHRDLKPANIKIRPDGAVKVLDFGLARTVESFDASAGGTLSPTITTPAMTGIGVILGTAAYMSPEQARGSVVDKRTDIWAFGVVLYEMLAGRRLVDETTVSDTLAVVLKGELKIDALPAQTPIAVRQLIARCLMRDVRRRLRDIGEARIAIEESMAHPIDGVSGPARSHVTAPLWQRLLPWTVAIAALILAGAAVWVTDSRETAPSRSVRRLSIETLEGLTISQAQGPSVLLSPDGRQLVIVGRANPGERSRLYVRRLDELQAASGWKPGKPAVLVAGPANELDADFSPDGRWLAFQSDESGRNEVYVRAFPGPGARTQVSAAGGGAPRWSSRGQKLFYRTDDGKIMAVGYSAASDLFRADRATVWSDRPVSASDVHPDGQRLAVLKSTGTTSGAQRVVLILNCFEELRSASRPSR